MTLGEGSGDICRFCFEGDEAFPLSSPCVCSGSQKFIHIDPCLRQWQRMVIVSQPTHPAYWTDDDRHTTCGVCLTKFTCSPPTRTELMTSFTGPEIAALIAVGCIIAAKQEFSDMIRSLPPTARGGNSHWLDSAYFISQVVPDNGEVTLRLEEQEQIVMMHNILTSSLDITMADVEYSLVAAADLEGRDDDLLQALGELTAPCTIAFRSPTFFADDHIVAVNLTRPMPASIAHAAAVAAAVVRSAPDSARVSVSHWIGGPCEMHRITTAIVLGGENGWASYTTLEDALNAAVALRGDVRATDDIVPGQTVQLIALEKDVSLNGLSAMANMWDSDKERWVVTLLDSGMRKCVKRANLVSLATEAPRVMAFWGDARWSRAQLLGEIARGSWGMCKAMLRDVAETKAPMLRATLDGRLVFAPESEMTEDYSTGDEGRRRLNALETRVRIRRDQPEQEGEQ